MLLRTNVFIYFKYSYTEQSLISSSEKLVETVGAAVTLILQVGGVSDETLKYGYVFCVTRIIE
jgi:hypothetical protein